MKMICRLFLICLITASFLQSCVDNAIYRNQYGFKSSEWQKTDTVTFDLNVEDTISKFDFVLTFRTKTDYLYSNMWIYILVTAPDGTTSKVAQEVPIAYPDGSWVGKISGTLVENKLRFDSKPFPLKGKYIFQLLNATQEDVIPYIEDVSFDVLPVKT